MDLVTQGLLGAAVGAAIGGRRLGWKAPALGFLGGLLPDVDVTWSGGLASINQWIYHRGFTHSIFFGPVVGSALAAVSVAVARRRGATESGRDLFGFFALFWIAVLLTHPLLDALTQYGTMLLAPFSSERFGVAALPIIDPVYSLLLIAGLVAARVLGWTTRAAKNVMIAALALSTAYGGLGYLQIERGRDLAVASLREKGIEPARVDAWTTMFSPWLRRVVAETPDGFHIGFVSTLSPRPIDWQVIPVDPAARDAARRVLATPEGAIFSRFIDDGPVFPLFADGENGREIQLLDLRYGFPNGTLTGFWGLAFRIDGETLSEPRKILNPRGGSVDDIRQMFEAKLGYETLLF